MFTIIMNILDVLTTESKLEKGTKIKIKYNYTEESKEGLKIAMFNIKNDKSGFWYFIFSERTIFLPEFNNDGTVNSVKLIEDGRFNMKINLKTSYILKFYLKYDMDFRVKKNEIFKKSADKNESVYVFMNKNDFLFDQKSSNEKDTPTFQIDEKTGKFEFNNEKVNELQFNYYSIVDFNLVLCDIIGLDKAKKHDTKKEVSISNNQSFLSYLSIFNLYNEFSPIYERLHLFHSKDENNHSLDPLIVDATLLDETEYKVIRELTEDEVKDLGLILKKQPDLDHKVSESEKSESEQTKKVEIND